MKGIWMMAAAVLLVASTGCSTKKDTSTLTAIDDNQEITTAKDSGMMTEEAPIEDLSDAVVAASDDMDTGMGIAGAPSAADAVVAQLQDIRFDYDQAVVRDQDKPILLSDANLLKSNPNVRVRVEGHCDERGTTAYNLALGERRATSTRRYLVALGVSPSQLVTVSYGEEKAACFDANEACWSRNRRAHMSAAN